MNNGQQQINIDGRNAPLSSGFDLLPPGEYPVQLDEWQVLSTKAGTGQYIKARFTVVEGPFENRKLFANFNFDNPSAEAVKIGTGQLREMLAAAFNDLAAGNQICDDALDAAIGREFQARVKIQHDKTGQYRDQNEITGFLTKDGGKITEDGIVSGAGKPAAGGKSAGSEYRPQSSGGQASGAGSAAQDPAPQGSRGNGAAQSGAAESGGQQASKTFPWSKNKG